MKHVSILMLLLCILILTGCAASHYDLGKQHLEAEQYDDALAEFDLARRERPHDSKLFREIGIAYYRKLDFKNAIQNLIQSFLEDSTDGRTLFYLGTAFEITDNIPMAMDIYGRYVDVSSMSGIRSSIEGRLEKLERKQMKAAAEKALADEDRLDVDKIPDSTLAVLYFENLGDNPDLDPIQKGLADMMITDLSKVKKLRVIERTRMQKLLEEMGLGMTGLVDERTAPRVGKLLGAARLVKGSFVELGGDQLRINANLIPVKSKARYTSRREVDRLDNFFKMEKNLVFGLLSRMGIRLTQEERDAIEIIPTENLLAFMAYCRGLDYEDRGLFDQASEFYGEAAMLDPEFSQALEKQTVSENLSSSQDEVTVLEQQYVSSEPETDTDMSVSAEPEAAEASSESTPESGAEIPSTDIVNRMIHTGNVMNQVFLPGVDSREPAQERNASTFGVEAVFDIRVDIPQN